MHHADVLSEQMLLAHALSGTDEIAEQFQRFPIEAFTVGVHRAVARAVVDTINRNERVHPPQIGAEAVKRVDTKHKAESVQKAVVDLALLHPPAGSFDFYAQHVLQQQRLRKISEVGERLWHMTSADYDLDVDSFTHTVRGLCDDLDAAAGVAAIEPPTTLRALLDEPDEPFDWLVPGLLERMDRLIVTAFEGVGKSELLAQFACTLAGGLHPFTGEPLQVNGLRVLVLDCENPRRKIKRRYRKAQEAVDTLRGKHNLAAVDWPGWMNVLMHSEGVDLTDPRECAHIEQRIAASSPDLVVAGPLYKMHRGDMNEETAARGLVAELDRLRTRYQFTLICEAHAPHGENSGGKRKLRPAGSSLFLRWPEFGVGLRGTEDCAHEEHPSVVDVVPWRASREERVWPRALHHGGPHDLPWTPANPDYWRQTFKAVN